MTLGHKRTHDIRVRSRCGDLSPLYEGLPIEHFGEPHAKPHQIIFTPSQLRKFIARCINVGRKNPTTPPADSFGFLITTTSVTTERQETTF